MRYTHYLLSRPHVSVIIIVYICNVSERDALFQRIGPLFPETCSLSYNTLPISFQRNEIVHNYSAVWPRCHRFIF